MNPFFSHDLHEEPREVAHSAWRPHKKPKDLHVVGREDGVVGIDHVSLSLSLSVGSGGA